MGLRFILGRAGTGKTRSCLEEIRSELAIDAINGAPLILLVPEQASFQMEKALTTGGTARGIIRAQVMSFRRLGWLVFQEVGGTNRQYLDELGKMMTLRSILLQQERSLKIFHGMVREQGFIEKLAGTLKEFKDYNIIPAQLEEQYQGLVAQGQQDSVLAFKLHDLLLLYREFQACLQGNHTDPDDYLHLLAQRIKRASSLKEARIWVDSFAGFTPQELQVLGSLMCHCRQVNLTLCLDSRKLSAEVTEMDLFHPSRVTYEKLQALAQDLGVPLKPPKLLDRAEMAHRFKQPTLGFLEKYYDQYQAGFPHSPVGLRLVKAANRRVEVEGVAREIQRLAREQGYRYRDMAVILRDLESYRELITTVFQEYQLPFFMDAKRPVTHHPLVELIIAALETINSFWSYEPLFRYLKTDLVPIRREQVDGLENYVLAYGIRGKLWLTEEPWDFGEEKPHFEAGSYQRNLREAREEAVAALRTFYRQVNNQSHLQVEQITIYLFELLQQLQVNRRLEAWCREAEEGGQLDVALEHNQVWDGVMNLFDQLVAALGETEMTLPEYTKVIEAGLQSLQLRLIPPALDQVLVGSIERSRQPELKAVFLLGLNEGVFPARIKEDEILSDGEREELAKAQLELAPTSQTRLFHEQYLSYIAFTRAGEYLWVSYPEADEAGKQLQPSILIRHLQELLPGLKGESLAGEPGKGDFPVLDYLVNHRKAIASLAEKLREAKDGNPLDVFWLEVYHWLINQPGLGAELNKALAALFYRNTSEPLEDSLIEKLYGPSMIGSVSRLETFAACPFKYFVQYGLHLRERELYLVDAPLKGDFYHQALKELVIRIQQKGKPWNQLSDEELAELTRQIVAALIPTMEHGILLSTPRYKFWSKVLEQHLQIAVAVLTEHARLGAFQPVAVELAFGFDGGLPPIKIKTQDARSLILRGRIDRIDLANIDGQVFLRVIDYKSSSRTLDLSQCYHGLTLQLPVYLNVALEHYRHFTDLPPEGAGMFYFPILSPVIKVDNPLKQEEARNKVYQGLKMRGWILADPDLARLMGAQVGKTRLIDVRLTQKGEFYKGSKVLDKDQLDMLRTFTRHKLGKLAQEIYQGETAIAPYRMVQQSPCTYCEYRPCCQFDSLVEGNSYRTLARLSEEELWAYMGNVEGGGKLHEQR